MVGIIEFFDEEMVPLPSPHDNLALVVVFESNEFVLEERRVSCLLLSKGAIHQKIFFLSSQDIILLGRRPWPRSRVEETSGNNIINHKL